LNFFFAGHGGDGFLKFQDAEEISNVEMADAFEQMWQKRRLFANQIHFFVFN
jgi:phosphatidylinositol glycan class K